MFQTRCATCHGQFGRGDGGSATALNPKPQNYADAATAAEGDRRRGSKGHRLRRRRGGQRARRWCRTPTSRRSPAWWRR
ncbi:MAG: c-type cytochrome [bacterium]|nr:c-type cytochrome [bacterium]